MIRRSSSITAALFLVLFFPLTLTAQTAQGGTINGLIKDQTGGALPGVAVEVKHEERGITRSATSDSSGRFRMPALPLGRYTVTATLSGFDTTTSRHNVVENEKTTDLSITMKLGAATESITVSAEVPVVDRTNVADRTNLRAEEFQKLPVGRNYQALMGLAPGVPTTGGGNVNAHGALSGNNLFLFDGADVTDPTTGTFASNLNYEAIQEMTMYTAGVSAEYGRAVGAVVNVITKSGGNNLSGSAKLVQTNDDWNAQNKTKNQVTGASLARTKFAHVNPTQNYTLGGPIWRDHAWFFGTYEKAKVTGAQRQTLVTNENYQQTTMDKFYDVRGTFQINPQNNIWIKKHASPTPGFIIDYWNNAAADLGALTAQDQTGNQLTGQWTGVFGPNFVAEALAAKTGETITVGTYSLSPLTNGAPHINQADGLAYNGATFVGAVDRPRKQATAALSYFRSFGQATHNFKVGYDWQSFKSTNVFGYPNNQYFVDASFNSFTKTYEPLQRRDYDPVVPSTSTGKIRSFYARDKFDVAKRWFIEAGLRYEKQTGNSDVERLTVDSSSLAPRLSVSYDLRGNGKSIVLGTAGRYYQFIIQDFSDSFAQNAQRANYNNFTWDSTTKQYVPAGRVTSSGNAFQPNSSVNPTYLDELTAGFEQQFGNTVGVGLRGIWRKWHDLIDDVRGFNADNTTFRRVVNYGPAQREYKGIEFTYEKRFSQHWYGAANYTYSRSSGNHFADTFSSLGDYIDAQCRTTVDPTIGNNGVIACQEVQDGPNKTGRSSFDRPHDLKAQGAYTFNLGPVALTAGSSGEWISGITFTENRSVNVLRPGTTTNAGPTATYFYEPRGSHRLANYYRVDGSLEGVVRVFRTAEVGLKAEIFNLTDNQAKNNLTNTTWCNNTTNPSATCTTARDTFGTATARGQYLAPRNYRITTLIRF